MGSSKFCRAHINKTTALKQLCSKYNTIFLGNRHIWRSRPHPAWFIGIIWYYRPYYTAATTAWVGNQKCSIGLVHILFEPAETIRCYQWHTIIISRSVFRSSSGISTRPNSIHPVHNTLDGIAGNHQLNFHLYADDTQPHMAFKPNNAESLQPVISNI